MYRDRIRTPALTEEQRLTLARKGEESSRLAVAEISMGYPLTGADAQLRLYDRRGNERDRYDLTSRGAAGRENDPNGIYLAEITHGANTEGLKIAAGWHLARLAFNYAPGAQWSVHKCSDAEERQRKEWEPFMPKGRAWPHTVRVPIVPTARYLAYVERCYGPAPVLPDVPGLTARQSERHWWQVERADGAVFRVSWSPWLSGDRWTAWAGPQRSKLVAEHQDPAELLARVQQYTAE